MHTIDSSIKLKEVKKMPTLEEWLEMTKPLESEESGEGELRTEILDSQGRIERFLGEIKNALEEIKNASEKKIFSGDIHKILDRLGKDIEEIAFSGRKSSPPIKDIPKKEVSPAPPTLTCQDNIPWPEAEKKEEKDSSFFEHLSPELQPPQFSEGPVSQENFSTRCENLDKNLLIAIFKQELKEAFDRRGLGPDKENE